MEEEARNILREALAQEHVGPTNLADAVGDRFESVGGVELQLPDREPIREPPEISE